MVNSSFPYVTPGLENFSLGLSQLEWCNLVCVEFFLYDKAQCWLAFVLLGVDATLGDECRIPEHVHSFREVECPQGYFKTFWMGI